MAFDALLGGDFQRVLEVTVFGGVVLGYEISNLTSQYKELSTQSKIKLILKRKKKGKSKQLH